MDKVLVEIYVPVLDRSFDMFIPKSSSMGKLCKCMDPQIHGYSP